MEQERKRIFVLRGGAILSQKSAWLKFGVKGDEIVIPTVILRKMQLFSGAKRNLAEDFIEYIKKICSHGISRVRQENGTWLRIVDTSYITNEIDCIYNLTDEDKQVFQICKELKENNPDTDVILVSQNVFILATAQRLNIQVEEVSDRIFPLPEFQYTGKEDIYVDEKRLSLLKSNGMISYPEGEGYLFPNQFVLINNYFFARYCNGWLYRFEYINKAREISPLNREQRCLFEAMYAPADVAPLVIVSGVAGTGKTFVTVQTALDQIGEDYDSLIIMTPFVFGHDEEIGTLPGGIEKKTLQYFGGIYDSIFNKVLADYTESGETNVVRRAKSIVNSYFTQGIINIQPLATIAGHSFDRSIIVVDEAQNIEPHYFLDVITRKGKGSKMVILGDPQQVKRQGLTSRHNGIVYIMEAWKQEKLAWQIRMNPQRVVRDQLAQRATEILM